MHSIFTVIDSSDSSFDLISLDDLKLALGIEDDSEDAQLQAAITLQSRIIADHCDRRLAFAEALETFTLDRNETLLPRQALVLKLYPVVEVFEVSTAGTADDYEFDPESGRLWMTSGQWGTDKIAVTYSGGYNLPDEAPARLQQAIIEAVNEGRTIRTRDPTVREVQHGDARISYFTPTLSTASSGYLSAVVLDLIEPYRRHYVA